MKKRNAGIMQYNMGIMQKKFNKSSMHHFAEKSLALKFKKNLYT